MCPWICRSLEIQNAVQAIQKFHNRVDILVNNAGMQVDKTIETLTVADWDLVMNVNLRGAFLLARELLSLSPSREAAS